MNLKLLVFIIIQLGFCRKCVDTTKTINRYDSDCNLSLELIREIEGYKDRTQLIMKQITNTDLGKNMYDRYTEFIDKYGARVSGSDVLEDAIDHMINLTFSYGVNDITTEGVRVPHWVRGPESVTMVKPYKKKIAVLGLGPNVPTPPEGITADVIVVDSFTEFDMIHPEIVKGKIVLFNAQFINYGETVIYRTQSAQRAAKKGAVAALIRSITPFSLYTPHTGYQQYKDDVAKIPSGAITLEDADLLRRLQDEGESITLNIKMNSTLGQSISRNTLVDIKGSEFPESMVIVSGHIDSWDVGQGAMDDGGGMMISWFAPVALSRLGFKPKRTIRAILWTAEEPGLIGAQSYLKRHENDLDNISLIMESDEGTFKPLGLDVAASKAGRCVITEILKLFSSTNKMTESINVGSDITLFVDRGVPGAALLNKNDHYFWYHHSEADTMSIQNRKDVISCAAFWTAFSYVVADLSINIPRA
ncbi:carboxypeptidase Q-like [Epargyreus clarus]|uniref:carboxypeptidase Q-like n=1 Tax=Epargyreus clarus TaxID=520877 RepID=UPI003C2C9651